MQNIREEHNSIAEKLFDKLVDNTAKWEVKKSPSSSWLHIILKREHNTITIVWPIDLCCFLMYVRTNETEIKLRPCWWLQRKLTRAINEVIKSHKYYEEHRVELEKLSKVNWALIWC